MLSERLKRLRKEEKITQSKLASLLNMPVSTYNGYENSLYECTHSVLIKLAEIFDVTTDYLLGVSNVTKIEKDNAMLVVTYKEKALIEEYRKCDDFGKAQSFGYVKALAKGTEQNFNDITKLQNKDED